IHPVGEKSGRRTFLQQRQLSKRQMPVLLGRAGGLARGDQQVGPEQVEAELERATLVNPAVVAFTATQHWTDRLEMGGLLDGCRPLRRGTIGSAGHGYVAVAPRLRGSPLHGVVPVEPLVGEGNEIAA